MSEAPDRIFTPPSREQIVALLESHGITPTQQRVEIAAILLARPQHLSAEEVLNLVKQGETPISKATVYNSLGLFAEKGLVREVIVDPTKVVYDSNTDAHHHLYDVRTGALTDIDAKEITIGRLPRLPDDMSVEGVDVIVRVRSRA